MKRPLPILLKEGLRGAERRWLRPILRLVRVPRSARARAKAMPAETEELLVALLRARRRQAVDGTAPQEALPACAGDVAALVHGLLAVPPPAAGDRRESTDPKAESFHRAA